MQHSSLVAYYVQSHQISCRNSAVIYNTAYLNFTNTRVQKATARNIDRNAPEQFARAREFLSDARITNARNACRLATACNIYCNAPK